MWAPDYPKAQAFMIRRYIAWRIATLGVKPYVSC